MTFGIFAMVLTSSPCATKTATNPHVGGKGAASAKSPTQVSQFTEKVPPKVRDAGGPELSCWINEACHVPSMVASSLTVGTMITVPACANGPLVTKSGIVARACPVAENPYVPEILAFVSWHVPESAAAAADIMNRVPARNILVTKSMDLGTFMVALAMHCGERQVMAPSGASNILISPVI